MKRIRWIVLASVLLVSLLLLLTACGPQPEQPDAPAQDVPPSEEQVILRVGGVGEDSPALEWAAAAFTEKYPNCTVIYEYLQGDYNETLKERLLSPGDDRIDVFTTTTNIQAGHALEGCGLDLLSCPGLDLSNAFSGLVNNYMYLEADGSPATKLYAIPFGAQMRGLYVNMSLLKSVGVEQAPTNQAELLAACATLKDAGYIPFHGDPGLFAQQLLYPWICNNVANADNYEEAYTLVNTRDPRATELFRDVFEFAYTLAENGYYDYKYSQETLKLCKDASTEGYCRSFLDIVEIKDSQGQGTGEYQLQDGVGQIAFLPSALSTVPTMDKMIEDYHSQIEYVFVPAPVGVEGGYVYLSPADAIAINKDSEKIEWAAKFLDFLFTPENNETLADILSVIPNTKDAYSYISELYDVPANHISEVGQATFDWSFYRVLTRSTGEELRALPAITKANAPSHLDPATGQLYPFDYFWEQFQTEFTSVQ